MKTKEQISSFLEKWVHDTGLAWWKVDAFWHTGKEARKFFKAGKDTTVIARTFSDWRYGEVAIHFNLPAMKSLSVEEIERAVVHELCHALINEMRAGGIDHEERVVTGLAKAFIWVRNFAKDERGD